MDSSLSSQAQQTRPTLGFRFREQAALEQVQCPFCGADHFEGVLSAPDPSSSSADEFHVVRCLHCGLHYTNPRPSAETIGRHYQADYRPHVGNAHHSRPLRSWYPLDWLEPPAKHAGEPRRLDPPHVPRLLDFGCGAGHFLVGASRLGWEPVGLDVSEAAVKAIRESTGIRALVGSLPHDQLAPASFDLITMWHSLEHVHEPKRTLREAHRLLSPSGRLIIAVPNFAGLPRQWFGSCWYGLDLPRHLIHFDPGALQRMLEETGFRVVQFRHPRHADWLRSSALLAQHRHERSFPGSLFRMKLFARLGAWWCQRKQRSDAMMILAERA
jgi:SAM-dependent methyltransferase